MNWIFSISVALSLTTASPDPSSPPKGGTVIGGEPTDTSPVLVPSNSSPSPAPKSPGSSRLAGARGQILAWEQSANNADAPAQERYLAASSAAACIDQTRARYAEAGDPKTYKKLATAGRDSLGKAQAASADASVGTSLRTAIDDANAAADAAVTDPTPASLDRALAQTKVAQSAVAVATKREANAIKANKSGTKRKQKKAFEAATKAKMKLDALVSHLSAAADQLGSARHAWDEHKDHAAIIGAGSNTDFRQIVHDSRAKVLDTVIDGAGCTDDLTVCLDDKGQLIGEDVVPARIEAGYKVTVTVIGAKKALDNRKLTIQLEDVERASRLLSDDLTPKEGDKQSQTLTCPATTDDTLPTTLSSEVFTVTKNTAVYQSAVKFENKPEKEDDKAPTYQHAHRFWVDHGMQWVDGGLLVAFTLDGKQRVTARAIPGSQERTLGLKKKTLISPVAALTVYPFGKRRGRFGAVDLDRCRKLATPSTRSGCRRRNYRRFFGELVGLQAGIDADITNLLDQFYFGGVVEIVNGLGFSVGAAVVEVEQIRKNLVLGQLVTSDADLKPAHNHKIRLYMGVSVSIGIIKAIQSLQARLKDLKP